MDWLQNVNQWIVGPTMGKRFFLFCSYERGGKKNAFCFFFFLSLGYMNGMPSVDMGWGEIIGTIPCFFPASFFLS